MTMPRRGSCPPGRIRREPALAWTGTEWPGRPGPTVMVTPTAVLALKELRLQAWQKAQAPGPAGRGADWQPWACITYFHESANRGESRHPRGSYTDPPGVISSCRPLFSRPELLAYRRIARTHAWLEADRASLPRTVPLPSAHSSADRDLDRWAKTLGVRPTQLRAQSCQRLTLMSVSKGSSLESLIAALANPSPIADGLVFEFQRPHQNAGASLCGKMR
jgi:hypothetical protein